MLCESTEPSAQIPEGSQQLAEVVAVWPQAICPVTCL